MLKFVESLKLAKMRFSILIALCYIPAMSAFGQITSQGSGEWTTPATWSCNCVPNVTSGTVTIQASHAITVSSSISVDQLTLAATTSSLTVSGGGVVLTIVNGDGPDIVNAGSVSTTNGGTITIAAGAEYQHNQNGGVIPTATWADGSTCRITGWGGASVLAGFRSSLTQSFFNFAWASPLQTQANVQFLGALRTVRGDLRIENTGTGPNSNRRITLGSTGTTEVETVVSGNFVVTGSSQVVINASGNYILRVDGNVDLSSTYSDPSITAYVLNSSSGTGTLLVGGDFAINSGAMEMIFVDGNANLNVTGNFAMNGGRIQRNGAGVARINFIGTGVHQYTVNGGQFENSIINFRVLDEGTLDLGTYPLGNAGGNGTFTATAKAKVIVRSVANEGAVASSILTTTRSFEPLSEVIYAGAAPQYMGSSHPSAPGVITRIQNENGVSLVNDVIINGDLFLEPGNLSIGSNRLTLGSMVYRGTNFISTLPSSRLEIRGSGSFGYLPFAGPTTLAELLLNRSNSGSISLPNNLTITESFSQVEGVINLDGRTLFLDGNYEGSGRINSTAQSFLEIRNAGTLPTDTEFSGSINALTLNRIGATFGASGLLEINNLVLQNGEFVNGPGISMANGGLIARSSGSLSSSIGSAGTYNVNYTNSIQISSGPEVTPAGDLLGNLHINASDEVILTSNININGNFTHNSGFFNAGTRIIQLAGSFTANAGSSFESSTLSLVGITSFSGTNLPDFGTINAQDGAVVNLPDEILVTGDVSFDAASTVNTNGGTVFLAGGGNQIVDARGAALENITLDKSIGTQVNLISTLRVQNTLTISSFNTVLNSGTGYLTLLSTSDSTSGNARIAPLLNGAAVGGTVRAERYMSSEGRIYRYISSPVASASVSQLQASNLYVTGNFNGSSTCPGCSQNPSLFYYDASNSQYVSYPAADASEVLEPGRGYAAFVRQNIVPGPVTVNFVGPVNQGDIPLPVAYNSNNPGDSWNLVGNPYPSSISWNAPGAWTKTNVSPTIAVRNNGRGSGGGRFQYWNGQVGDPELAGGIIAQGQAFWIRTTGALPELRITERAKTDTTGVFYRQSSRNVLVMRLQKGAVWDRSFLQISPAAAVEQDLLDVPKLANDFMDFAIKGPGGERLAINAVDRVSCAAPMALDLQFAKNSAGAFLMNPAGTYQLSFDMQGEVLRRMYKLVLVDKYSGNESVITPDFTYTFEITSDPASRASDRLQISFSDVQPVTDVPIVGSTYVCDEGSVSLFIESPQQGFEYYLAGNGRILTEKLKSDDGPIHFGISATALLEGKNEIYAGISSVCKDYVGNVTVAVTREVITAPVSEPVQICGSGVAELSVKGPVPGHRYFWYESPASPNPASIGETFKTEHLIKSRSYYVARVSPNGCVSGRSAVQVTVVSPGEPVITVNNGALISNFAEANQWYLNGTAIPGGTGSSFVPEESGYYSLETSIDGCKVRTDEIYVKADNDNGLLQVYPNPVKDKLTINAGGLKVLPSGISIQSPSGQLIRVRQVLEADGNISLDLSGIASGIYYLCVKEDGRQHIFKVHKE